MNTRRFVKGAGAVLGSLLCMGFWCGGAQAAAGDLDVSFGVGGRAFSNFQKFIAIGRSGALQSDKKIVSAGSGARFFNSDQFTGFDFIVTRNKADGTLDTDFGYDGVAFADFGSNDLLSKVVVQSDGKILVGGYTDFVSGDNSRSVFALARFNGNGKLDTSFGIGGKVVSVFSDRSVCLTSMALQSDGKIVAVGCLDSASQSGNFLVVRFNANGTLDTSFGTNGVVTEDLDAFNDSFNSVVVQSDGKILAGGTSSDPNNSSSGRFALARYNANGTPDTSFDGDGKAFTDFDGGASAINSLALQSDGKIVAGGNASGFVSDFALARYNTDGTLDTGFGTNGRITTDFAGDADSINSVVVQSDGKILAGGEAQSEDGIAGVLARYNINGTPDTSFGNAGQVTSRVFRGIETINDLLLQSNEKVVAVGTAINGFGFGSGFAAITLARYNLEQSFSVGDVTKSEGNDGSTTFDFPVTLSTSSTRSVTVDFATQNGSAIAGNGVPFDYSSRSGTLTFAPGQTTRNVSVVVRSDLYSENDETFFVNLSNASDSIAIKKAQGIGTITNDDGTTAPVVSVPDVAIAEGNSGTKSLIFTFTLNKPSEASITLNYATANGTAISGNASPADYSARSGVLTFAPGQISRTVAVTIYGDTRVEPNETFRLNLSNASGAALGRTAATGTINNDD